MDGVVLVLNQNYEPLNVCNVPRAFRLVFGFKAEVVEYDHQTFHTPRAASVRAKIPAIAPPASADQGVNANQLMFIERLFAQSSVSVNPA